jgi:hypothetical protein
MKSNLYIFISIVAFVFALTACRHQWKDPDTSLAAQSISISNLISSRDAYDSSGVSLIGKVWNLEVGSTKSQNDDVMEETYTTFILADRMGTGVDVYVPGEVPIQEGDFVRVVGIYRKELQTTGDYFSNVVDAIRIEDWRPGFKYWIQEFEFD